MEQNITPRSPAAVIIFSLITCGIYAIYWIYQFSVEMKEETGREDVSPGLETFLCVICFPYCIYWSYRCAELLKAAQQKRGKTVENDLPVLMLVLTILGLFIVAMAILQVKANELRVQA